MFQEAIAGQMYPSPEAAAIAVTAAEEAMFRAYQSK